MLEHRDGAPAWADVWASRGLEASPPDDRDPLAVALALDGYDSPTADGLTVAAWCDFAAWWCASADVLDGESVVEVGCGCGAFLEAVARARPGAALSGLDYSASLVAAGASLFPHLHLAVGEAASLPSAPRADHVVAASSFHYFPSLDYAATVIGRMRQRAVRTVSLLDLPDAALRREAEALRRGALTAEEYEARYAGLPHLGFDRDWVRDQFPAAEWEVALHQQSIDAYPNSEFRFNAVARRTPGGDA